MSRTDVLRERLESGLAPVQIRIIDDSLQHAGHAGAGSQGESHFSIEVISPRFAGLPRIARHRLIHQALGDAFDAGLHALHIVAKAPGE